MDVLSNMPFHIDSFSGFRQLGGFHGASMAQHGEDTAAKHRAADQLAVEQLDVNDIAATVLRQEAVEQLASMQQKATSAAQNVLAEPWIVASPLGHGLILLIVMVLITAGALTFCYFFGGDDESEDYRKEKETAECDESSPLLQC
eukprot:GEMP01089422.1.p1 GENE.GEMP01089422.1~~GEMP01089422.1.p1  ORF type:complete len:145 (+),score=40.70 GEMP01089422.1:219-653(+)